ncbi:DUF2256 domain-containing protein [Luminiphilus sp.]|nr:DUF2256 domain-containing protein [Luminiphilus sp.]
MTPKARLLRSGAVFVPCNLTSSPTPQIGRSTVKKSDLPTKICPVCDRPFAWRAKWRLNWESVVYCSKRCASRRYTIKNKP